MCYSLRKALWKRAVRRIKRATDQRIGIRWKCLPIPVLRIIQKKLRVGDAVLCLDNRVVDLGNANVENPVPGPHNQRTFIAKRVCKACARSEVIWLKRDFSRRPEERVRDQILGGKGLQVPSHDNVNGEVICHADSILSKCGVFSRIGVRSGAPEILQIVVRYLMGIGPQRRKLQAGLSGPKRERIDLDRIEKIFTALLAGEEVVDRGEERIAAELQRMPLSFQAHGFGEVEAMLPGLPRQHVGPPDSIENRRNLHQNIVTIAEGLLQIARKLQPEMADPALREARCQRDIRRLVETSSSPLLLMAS